MTSAVADFTSSLHNLIARCEHAVDAAYHLVEQANNTLLTIQTLFPPDAALLATAHRSLDQARCGYTRAKDLHLRSLALLTQITDTPRNGLT